ncbi:MAG: DUF1631 family protein [Gammaproteobacteria bacterium]|nr:DUF1631 family protein [Gammaproteobacteria bacterium]
MNPLTPRHQACLAAFRDALGATLLQAEELLFALAGQSSGGSAVDLHLNTLRYLRKLRSDGTQAITQHLAEQWAGGKFDAKVDPLVSQALSRLAVHAEAVHFEALAAIERGLRAAGTEAVFSMDDIKPQAFTSAIAAYLAEQPAPPPVQLLLVRLLDQLLVPAMDEMYQRIKQILEPHSRTSEGHTPNEMVDHTATGVMERDALLAHLDAIQSRVCGRVPDQVTELHQLRGVPELPHDVVLTPELQRLTDLMGLMVYDAVTDPSLSPSFKTMLLRMHLPLMKAALLDHEVLHDAKHPVRQLWSRLIDLARVPNAEQAPWRPRVERVIDSLCSDFAHDLGIFTTALEKLRTVEHLPRDLSPAMERAASQHASAVSFNEARTAATQAIRATLASHGTVPQPLRTFLLQTWGPLMLLIAQRTGAQGDDWEQAYGMMRELVSLSAAGNAGCSESVEPLLHKMQATLKHYGLKQSRFHKAFEELRQILLESTHSKTKKPETEAPPASGSSPQPAQPSLALPPRVVDEFIRMAFQPGEWFLVHVAEGQVPRRLKAYHVDTSLGVLVFADRLEQPVVERPIGQFIDDVLAGRSHPVFEDERYNYAVRQLKQYIATSLSGPERL